jgi:hypothetical protein
MTLTTVTLTDSSGTYVAELNKAGTASCGVEFQGNNPVIIIPVPADVSATATEGGAESMNLKMMTDNIIINFKLFDTFGTFAMAPPATTFEKLRYMFKYDPGKKTLVIGAKTFYVVISNLNISFDMEQSFGTDGYMAGVPGTMTLTVVNSG